MLPIVIEGHNMVLGGKGCVRLFVRTGTLENGSKYMLSSWEPSPSESKKIFEGAKVAVLIACTDGTMRKLKGWCPCAKERERIGNGASVQMFMFLDPHPPVKLVVEDGSHGPYETIDQSKTKNAVHFLAGHVPDLAMT